MEAAKKRSTPIILKNNHGVGFRKSELGRGPNCSSALPLKNLKETCRIHAL